MRAVDLLRRHGLRDGARVFNLGAHQGVVAAAAAESGTLYFHMATWREAENPDPGWSRFPPCPSTAAAHGPPDVLFIDMEGAEGEALRGARVSQPVLHDYA